MTARPLKPYQTDFLELALEHEVLAFGAFKLKSGRVSPYFFNLGRISDGVGLRRLAHAYAAALIEADLSFDLLFGPAYKGIPLAAAVSCACAERGRDVGFAYDRKEAKDHGEGGVLVGAEVTGRRVVIIDDVLTAGTAMRQSILLLRAAGAIPVAAMIALDRQERGADGRSAVAQLAGDQGVTVHALVDVEQILDYLSARVGRSKSAVVDSIRAYQSRYGSAGRGDA